MELACDSSRVLLMLVRQKGLCTLHIGNIRCFREVLCMHHVTCSDIRREATCFMVPIRQNLVQSTVWIRCNKCENIMTTATKTLVFSVRLWVVQERVVQENPFRTLLSELCCDGIGHQNMLLQHRMSASLSI